jgi:acyl-coenzyme A synthetase/AMP-(fatty) acid ligase
VSSPFSRGERGELCTRGYGVMLPRHWKLVDAFPMTVTGKVQKFRMREMAIEELGLEVVATTKTA